jgi:hypothetical protein
VSSGVTWEVVRGVVGVVKPCAQRRRVENGYGWREEMLFESIGSVLDLECWVIEGRQVDRQERNEVSAWIQTRKLGVAKMGVDQ